MKWHFFNIPPCVLDSHRNTNMSGRKFIYFAYDNLMLSNRMLCCVQRNAKRLGQGKLKVRWLIYSTYLVAKTYEVLRLAKKVGIFTKIVLQHHRLMYGSFHKDWYGTMPSIKKKCDCVVWGALWELDDCFKEKLNKLV